MHTKFVSVCIGFGFIATIFLGVCIQTTQAFDLSEINHRNSIGDPSSVPQEFDENSHTAPSLYVLVEDAMGKPITDSNLGFQWHSIGHSLLGTDPTIDKEVLCSPAERTDESRRPAIITRQPENTRYTENLVGQHYFPRCDGYRSAGDFGSQCKCAHSFGCGSPYNYIEISNVPEDFQVEAQLERTTREGTHVGFEFAPVDDNKVILSDRDKNIMYINNVQAAYLLRIRLVPKATPTPAQITGDPNKTSDIEPDDITRDFPDVVEQLHLGGVLAEPCVNIDGTRNEETGCPTDLDLSHTVKLTLPTVDIQEDNTTPIPPDMPLYLVECIVTDDGTLICASGDGDPSLASNENFTGAPTTMPQDKLPEDLTHEFVGIYTQDGGGESRRIKGPFTLEENPHVYWSSITNKQVAHMFIAMYQPPQSFASWSAFGSELEGRGIDMSGHNQGTFELAALGNTIYYDPYGKVFDSLTLEPIDGATVTLLQKRKDGSFTPTESGKDILIIENPAQTRDGGSFRFLVPDGTYRLTAEAKEYSFPNDPDRLNPGHERLYEDIYRGEDIVQKGKIEHRTIPLDPLNPEAAIARAEKSTAKLISLNQYKNKETKTHVIEGVVSHPRSMVVVYGKKPKESVWVQTGRIGTVEANTEGQFYLEIPKNVLDEQEAVGDIEIQKPRVYYPLALRHSESNIFMRFTYGVLDSLLSRVQAEEPPSSVQQLQDPMLPQLRGYAKDKEGTVLPNVRVDINLAFSRNPYASTYTNVDGMFAVSSQHIPPLPYVITYHTPDGVITKTTSDFLQDNQQ